MSNTFEKYVNMLPVDWERLVAMGVKYLSDQLDAKRVKFMRHENGISIGIVTDEENKEKAQEFWDNYVQPALEGE